MCIKFNVWGSLNSQLNIFVPDGVWCFGLGCSVCSQTKLQRSNHGRGICGWKAKSLHFLIYTSQTTSVGHRHPNQRYSTPFHSQHRTWNTAASWIYFNSSPPEQGVLAKASLYYMAAVFIAIQDMHSNTLNSTDWEWDFTHGPFPGYPGLTVSEYLMLH